MFNLIKLFHCQQNIMTFNKCSIGGISYGDVVDDSLGDPLEINEVCFSCLQTFYNVLLVNFFHKSTT
jgi:hypothetical protein